MNIDVVMVQNADSGFWKCGHMAGDCPDIFVADAPAASGEAVWPWQQVSHDIETRQ